MIEVNGVSKRYGDTDALTDVSVSVPDGSLTALLGPSGGGKTTLLRVIAGLETPDTGTVVMDDQDVTTVPVRRRGIGFVFQHYAAFKHMSVADNVAFGLSVRKRPKADVKAKVDELLQLVGLAHLATRRPDQLSGGQRQRMALARALAVEPKVLLLDEPFGALDARVREELRNWLRRLHDEVNVTTLFVTHDQSEAMEISEQIVVVNEGKVEQIASPQDIYDRPATEFVMNFVGPVTRVGGQLVRPHDVQVLTEPAEAASPAVVQRLLRLGFEVRAELLPEEGEPIVAQLSKSEADLLELAEGDIVHVRLDPTAPTVATPAS
ncbi:MAG: sulfate/thiosulfate transport system ATP-binding protein [Solirubrobacteraceae bacterium]|nr:sulfate/thiosulfate transport system ATP-binding protein [Solirubrobacteraceae bacterium]